jgi:hypothetical protein
MLNKSVLALFALLVMFGVSSAGDLYYVSVQSSDEALQLRQVGVDPVMRLKGGYLVLIDDSRAEILAEAALDARLVATDVERDQLAVDGRFDRQNVDKYNLIFEEDNLKLYKLDVWPETTYPISPEIFPVSTRRPTIEYSEPHTFSRSTRTQDVPLEDLIDLVNRDSLESYLYTLQDFFPRVAGEPTNTDARNWIVDQFQSYGYDSIKIDHFTANLGGTPTDCQNVIVTKVGTRWPGQHVVVGAHRDAVWGSPGADDNGTGSVGVLEIARILADLETDMTFIFVLFDAEEWGLYGSYHYVDDALARGDSIVYMLNMDMIGHYENDSQARLYHGTDPTFSQQWLDLCSSLLGMSGYLAGTASNSDHAPFVQAGFNATFVQEYVFSTVYHSPWDSTSFISFPYLTKMVKVSLANVYEVSATAGPQPALAFDFPEGMPSLVTPGFESSFEVQVRGTWEGVPVAGSGTIHYSINGGLYASAPMTTIGDNLYEATLPPFNCNDKVSFYVSASEATSGIFYSPDPAEPYLVVAATDVAIIFEDNFQTDKGWTVGGDALDGIWERGVPVGDGSYGDPITDYDGSGQCYLTGNRSDNSDVDVGTTSLISPTLDMAGGDTRVHYARWFANHFGGAPYSDTMHVFLSNDDGGSWVLVDRAGPSLSEEAGTIWYEHDFWVSEFVTPTATMKLRFDASDVGSGSVVEGAIDAVSLSTYSCASYIFVISTESAPDWTRDVPYSRQLESLGGTGAITWSDKNLDLNGTGLTLSPTGLLAGTPAVTGLMSFVAMATDELDSTVEKTFEFTINSPVLIVTSSLPTAMKDSFYSRNLLSSGGTGTITWSNPGDALDGTGLTLSETGRLSGTPQTGPEIVFTARATDVTTSYDEKELTLTVELPFMCGDINDDQAGPDISDITYLVTYFFGGGPPPPVEAAADVNSSGGIDISDLTYMVDYLFGGGPPPNCL